jgi:hypothetical protein
MSGNPAIEERASYHFGGQLSYLWRGMVGAEFLGDFSPSFRVDNSVAAVSGNPHLNTYMANAIGALPLGAGGRVQPYASGGFGAVQMRADVFNPVATPIATPVPTFTTTSTSQFDWGGNIGGGVMFFADRVGFRADLRYYRARTNNNISRVFQDQQTEILLSGLTFWRANLGVALRW